MMLFRIGQVFLYLTITTENTIAFHMNLILKNIKKPIPLPASSRCDIALGWPLSPTKVNPFPLTPIIKIHFILSWNFNQWMENLMTLNGKNQKYLGAIWQFKFYRATKCFLHLTASNWLTFDMKCCKSPGGRVVVDNI